MVHYQLSVQKLRHLVRFSGFGAFPATSGVEPPSVRHPTLTLNGQISFCSIQLISSGVNFCDATGTLDDSWVNRHDSAHDWNLLIFIGIVFSAGLNQLGFMLVSWCVFDIIMSIIL